MKSSLVISNAAAASNAIPVTSVTRVLVFGNHQ